MSHMHSGWTDNCSQCQGTIQGFTATTPIRETFCFTMLISEMRISPSDWRSESSVLGGRCVLSCNSFRNLWFEHRGMKLGACGYMVRDSSIRDSSKPQFPISLSCISWALQVVGVGSCCLRLASSQRLQWSTDARMGHAGTKMSLAGGSMKSFQTLVRSSNVT